jgi:hypothetical protein
MEDLEFIFEQKIISSEADPSQLTEVFERKYD